MDMVHFTLMILICFAVLQIFAGIRICWGVYKNRLNGDETNNSDRSS